MEGYRAKGSKSSSKAQDFLASFAKEKEKIAPTYWWVFKSDREDCVPLHHSPPVGVI